jgi:hypothetical protein
MQPMRSCVIERRGFPFFLCGGEGGWGGAGQFFLSSCVWCEERTVHCSLSRQDFFLFWGGGAGFVKAKSSQVTDMFPKEFQIAPHFYPICFGKCCPPSTNIGGQKAWNGYFKREPSILGSLHSFIFFSDRPIKLAYAKEKNWTWEAPHLMNRRGEWPPSWAPILRMSPPWGLYSHCSL